MEWIIGILAALVAVLLIILAVYKRQIRDICRQLAFLKEYDSNLLITRQMDAFGIRELTDELNEMLERAERAAAQISEKRAGYFRCLYESFPRYQDPFDFA